MNSHYDMVIPLPIIVDITNNLYQFARAAEGLDVELGQQFKVSYRPQISGPWWRTFYWQGFHGGIKQVAAKTMTLFSDDRNKQAPALSQVEAAHFLPYLDVVYNVIDVWRDSHIELQVRKERLVNMFSPEVGRLIVWDSAEAMKNQWYEEREPLSLGQSSFLAHLERCPLRDVRPSVVPLDQAIYYWNWIDHVLAQRTFCREDGARNLKLRRMEQAVTFCRLIDYAHSLTGRDLSPICVPVDDSLRTLFHPDNVEAVAAIVDTHEITRTKDTIGLEIFIESDTLGAALRALLPYLPR